MTKRIIVTIVVFGLIALLIFAIVSCSNNYDKARVESDKAAFSQQMQQDPSTWNQEQKDRYNNFTNWLSSQNNT